MAHTKFERKYMTDNEKQEFLARLKAPKSCQAGEKLVEFHKETLIKLLEENEKETRKII